MLCFLTLLALVGRGTSLTSTDRPGLILLQVSAQRHYKGTSKSEGQAPELPSVDELLSSSGSIAGELSEKVSELEQQLAELQREQAAGLNNRRAVYEKNLTALQDQLKSAEDLNMATATAIDGVKRDNSALLMRAQRLSRDNELLRIDLHKFQENISTAEEFVDRALDGTNDTAAEELAVLHELEQRDADRRARSESRERLDEISAATGFSLLGLRSILQSSDDDVVGSLQASFEKLLEEQRESIASLKGLFLDEHSRGAERLAKLLQLQGRLNTSMATAEKLHVDLQQAVTHLESVQATLLGQAKNLRLFMGSLGQRPLPAFKSEAHLEPEAAVATTLLQQSLISSEEKVPKASPDVVDAVGKPDAVSRQ
mmetsp:Transcript_55890/g.120921  ORF Transcript_55890/g.120921 Transcript_55890/m.120921 type:complete len:371 (-) Transcript_55890:196-1308(-)|eukprot:CAMPEP_0170600440 /NCGR_PEP_ID=MMETSP0224-20130122/17334_1 /TAXON_ID=285029 /ORGANISM="Togula jolla, Strain CCCM 725" /LENGTH=370 /DNA_ID=CAMNT_0010925163 /DNA_START=93 /DNA_END=1205 /DNA_ORIENTATION=+